MLYQYITLKIRVVWSMMEKKWSICKTLKFWNNKITEIRKFKKKKNFSMASIFEVETSLFKKRIIHFPHLMSLQHKKVAQLPLVVTLENLVWYIKFGSILLVSISSIPPCCATLWCCIKLVGRLGPCAPENKMKHIVELFQQEFL